MIKCLIKILIISVLLLSVISCANPKPRKPVAHTGGMDVNSSIKYNKRLYNLEIQSFKAIMQKDSLHTYIASNYGFWYTYLNKIEEDTSTPIKGNEVVFTYNIKDIYGETIYSEDELGNKTYLVDQQDFMQGIQEGIKIMKVNEKVLFLLPSLKAYGVYGDGNKIPTNKPLIVTIELLNIQE